MRRLALTVLLAAAVPAAATDYVLVTPLRSTSTYLMDRDGAVVHEWTADTAPGIAAYLLL